MTLYIADGSLMLDGGALHNDPACACCDEPISLCACSEYLTGSIHAWFTGFTIHSYRANLVYGDGIVLAWSGAGDAEWESFVNSGNESQDFMALVRTSGHACQKPFAAMCPQLFGRCQFGISGQYAKFIANNGQIELLINSFDYDAGSGSPVSYPVITSRWVGGTVSCTGVMRLDHDSSTSSTLFSHLPPACVGTYFGNIRWDVSNTVVYAKIKTPTSYNLSRDDIVIRPAWSTTAAYPTEITVTTTGGLWNGTFVLPLTSPDEIVTCDVGGSFYTVRPHTLSYSAAGGGGTNTVRIAPVGGGFNVSTATSDLSFIYTQTPTVGPSSSTNKSISYAPPATPVSLPSLFPHVLDSTYTATLSL